MKINSLVRAIVGALFVAFAFLVLGTSSVHAQAFDSQPLPTWLRVEEMPQHPAAPIMTLEDSEQFTPAATSVRNVPWIRQAFVSYRYGNPDIFLASSDGSGQVRLTNTVGGESRPSVSSDGKWIAYDMNTGGDAGRELLMISTAGGAPILIADTSGDATNISPAFSPDSTRIAFVSTRDGDAEIYVYTLATGALERITWNPLPDYDPSWNLATGELLWARQVSALEGVVVQRTHSGAEELLSGPISLLQTPKLDPSGKYLYFTGDQTGDALSDVIRITPNGTHIVAASQMIDTNEFIEHRLGSFTTTFRTYVPYPDFPYEWEVEEEFVLLFTSMNAKRYDGVWYLMDMQIGTHGSGSDWIDFGPGPNGYADRVSMDNIAPTVVLLEGLGMGTVDEVLPKLESSDRGGSELVLFEYEIETSQFTEGARFRAPLKSLPLLDVSLCGSTTWRLRAVDGAGNWSPWAEVTAQAYKWRQQVTVRDLSGAHIPDIQLSVPNGWPADPAPTGVDGKTTLLGCWGFPYWDFPEDSNWQSLTPNSAPTPNITALPKNGRPFVENFQYWRPDLIDAWQLADEPIDCRISLDYDPMGHFCLALLGVRPGIAPIDREVVAQNTRPVASAPSNLTHVLLLHYKSTNLQPNTPLTITVQTSAWPTPTVVLRKMLPQTKDEIITVPFALPLGETITTTIATREFANAGPARLELWRLEIIPRSTPVVEAVEVSETPMLAFAQDGEMIAEANATLPMTITGANFVGPFEVTVGNKAARNIVQVDANTLRAELVLPLPLGVHTLYVTNVANTDMRARGGLSGAVQIGVRAYIPLVQIRSTPVRR